MKSLDIYFVNHAKYHGNMHDNNAYAHWHTQFAFARWGRFVTLCFMSIWLHYVYISNLLSDISSQFCCMLVKYIRMLTKKYASGISQVYARQISALVNKILIPEQIIISETIRSFHVKSYFEAVCFNNCFVTGTGMWYMIYLVCQHAQK